ncbi:MAG: hypothetical protein M1832_000820 [Thelocarpon impressellum]|nr:MAG: hypothetical protein M1832_000820 [Thelocarpon impressellum]
MRLSLLPLLSLLVPYSITTAYTPLSDSTLLSLPADASAFSITNASGLLAPILRPRVPGTPGHAAVLEHFVRFFATQLPEWMVSFQNSTSRTPGTGNQEVPFVNVIVTRDPPWAREGEVGRLALVAHYDSLRIPEGFIGATDSAAPCAVLLHVARSVDAALTRKWAAMEKSGRASDRNEERGVQILLLDGEEAFVKWSDADSLYGARSLAETWEATPHPALSTYANPLASIELFVLLDLLGSANPQVPSYFPTTHWAYAHLASLEQRLRSLHLFLSSPNHPSKRTPSSSSSRRQVKEPVFLPTTQIPHNPSRFSLIQDDHLPFLARGVEVLHLIPSPFPAVWHDMRKGFRDDGESLDGDTVLDWAALMVGFVAEWCGLEGFFADSQSSLREARSKTEL